MADEVVPNHLLYVRMKTCALKVHLHCQGCVKKVNKVLHKLEGVWHVEAKAEENLVIVRGTMDCIKIVEKLAKAGKKAEIIAWDEHTEKSDDASNSSCSDDDQETSMERPLSCCLPPGQQQGYPINHYHYHTNSDNNSNTPWMYQTMAPPQFYNPYMPPFYNGYMS